MLIKHANIIVLWPIYLTIANLSHEIQKSRIKPEKIMINLILIYKNNLLIVKIEIYHHTIRIMTKNIFNHRLINITNKI